MLPFLLAGSLLAGSVAASAADAVRAAGLHRSRSPPPKVRGEGFIRAPLSIVPPTAESFKRLMARQNEVEVKNIWSGTRYTVDVEIGTPPQTVTLILDTGSPDTWVNPTCETLLAGIQECRKQPFFNSTKSSSFNKTQRINYLQYGSGTAIVQWVFETLTIGSATIEEQIIGINSWSENIPNGILGLSPPVTGNNDYPYVLDTMVAQGLIKSRAFSLDLRGVDNPTGSIIFGGIDTGKFIGNLVKLPMLPASQTPLGAYRYYVTMTGIGVTFPDGQVVRSDEITVPVFLDSGGTFSQLPPEIVQALASVFTNAVLTRDGYWLVPCGVTEFPGSIDFYFAGKTIRVSFNDFILELDGICVLGVLSSEDEYVLGDTFLRAVYAVFDQDNQEIHLAQAANCGTNLVAIGSGPDAVPSSRGLCTALPMPTVSAGVKSLNLQPTKSVNVVDTPGPTGIVAGPGPGGPSRATTGLPELPTINWQIPKWDENESAVGRAAGVGMMMMIGAVVANMMWLC